LTTEGSYPVGVIIAVFLLALLLAGLGFVIHLLWWLAIIVLILWALGFVFRGPARAGRWYRW
jgi:hypothetical protein